MAKTKRSISQKQQKILSLFLEYGTLSSSEVQGNLQTIREESALVTVKRALSQITSMGLLTVSGAGPSTVYTISALGRIVADVDARAYCAVEPDKRYGLSSYNFELLPALPVDLFSEKEQSRMEVATAEYRTRTTDVPPAIQKKELERLVIELSWKSSKIEGNTYTLLDTEKLILEHTEAPGHPKSEAVMILNHKSAFDFVREHRDAFIEFSRANMETVHAFLVKDLDVGSGLRKKAVGVLGSKYKPLDNIHQIRDTVKELARAVVTMGSAYAKALVALVGISYIQPFEDGNKRTARLMANALLMAHDCAPLSYRSVDEVAYREAILVFYELNSLVPFKKIFVEQYNFAARNYSMK